MAVDVLSTFLNAALSAVGQPYVWGGNSLARGVDCSGLVSQALLAVGYLPPRTAAAQANWAAPVATKDAQPGDLVFWDQTGSRDRVAGADHVGIYLGNGMVVEASSGQRKVVTRKLWGNYRFGRVIGAKPQANKMAGPVQLGQSGITWDGAGVTATAAAPATGVDISTDPYAVAAATATANRLPPNASEAQIEEFIRANYSATQVGLLQIPELRSVMLNAAREGMTADRMLVEIERTAWWQSRSEAMRQWDVLKATNPSEAQAQIDAKRAELGPQLAQLGLADDPSVAEQALRLGWTPDQLRQDFATRLQGQSDQSGLKDASAPDVTADSLVTMARTEYLVPINRQDAERWAIDIFAGRKTEDQLRNYLQRQAEARFPGLVESGFTPGEYMAPIRNVIAETLEVQPADVDLLDRRWSAVLETQASDGKFRPMTIAEAQSWARSQQEFRYTKGAQKEAAAMAETLGRTFGAVA